MRYFAWPSCFRMLPSPGAPPVRQLLADSMAVAKLQVIRRQRDPELKRAVELAACGNGGEALSLLAEQCRLTEIPETSARYQRIALDFLRAHEAGQKTLVVSPGNDERQALNEQIRKILVENGHVQNRSLDHTILVPARFDSRTARPRPQLPGRRCSDLHAWQREARHCKGKKSAC
jgi:hypothetical protein